MNALAKKIARPSCRLEPVREVQRRWAQLPLRERLAPLRALRHEIAENADVLAEIAAALDHRPAAEKLMSEVLPLAEACRWLERKAPRVLAPCRHNGWFNPLWLHGLSFETQRRPFGIVLVIGPRNYPLFLPAVQSLQALAAGNAVLLKPAPGTRKVALAFAEMARVVGINPRLLSVLRDDVESAQEAIRSGVDKVVFTGSSKNGAAVLAALAPEATPSVMELSGQDAIVVLADADLDLVVRALRFGRELNDGDTCIAPRRLIIEEAIADALLARISWADLQSLQVQRVGGWELVLREVNADRFGLGASIFSRDIGRARALAGRIQTGCVTINDLIVPTADPRMPFGGVKASGFGTTRGAEGLLEMTFPHVVALRRGRRRLHFSDRRLGDAKIFSAYVRARHGRRRLRAWCDLVRAVRGRSEGPPQA